jgi:anthranilate synthase component 2
MKVLILDNYDSFVYNLKQYLDELGADCLVARNDSLSLDQVAAADPDAIVISPGPGLPSDRRDFGICGDVLTGPSTEVPTLGVCLGHQGIAHFHGGKVVKAPHLVHGKTSLVSHDGCGLYEGLPNPFTAGRYHSFVVSDDLPSELAVTSRAADGTIMGIRHRRYPIEGVQFHPESVLTPQGKRVLDNFLRGTRT